MDRSGAPAVLLERAPSPEFFAVRDPSSQAGVRPWLWWNLLSADAPTVALVWALLFARAVGMRLPPVGATVLLACIWLIYVLDRVLDGWRSDRPELLSARHRFYRRHWRVMLACASAVSAVVLWLTLTRMVRAVFHAGLAMLAVAALYLLAVHASSSVRRYCPKEAMTGMVFSLGSVLPLWARMSGSRLWLAAPVLLFGALCWLNCAAIECWENHRAGRAWREPPPAWMAWIDRHLGHAGVALMLLALLLALSPLSVWKEWYIFLACALSALAFAVLDAHSETLSPEALRVLADGALLSPALLLLPLWLL